MEALKDLKLKGIVTIADIRSAGRQFEMEANKTLPKKDGSNNKGDELMRKAVQVEELVKKITPKFEEAKLLLQEHLLRVEVREVAIVVKPNYRGLIPGLTTQRFQILFRNGSNYILLDDILFIASDLVNL